MQSYGSNSADGHSEAPGDRLAQLRAMVDRLERLPASTQRDWMLQEARSRMVDVETGDEPRPMRRLDEEPPARPPERPGSQDRSERAVKRPSPKPAPAREVQPTVPTPPPRVPETARTSDPLETDELLWLEEPAAEPADDSTELPRWRRGLRG